MLGFYMLCYNSYYINYFSNVLNNKLNNILLNLFDFSTLTMGPVNLSDTIFYAKEGLSVGNYYIYYKRTH